MKAYLHSRLNAHGMLRAAESGGMAPRILCTSKWGKTFNNVVKEIKLYYCEFPTQFYGRKFILGCDLI